MSTGERISTDEVRRHLDGSLSAIVLFNQIVGALRGSLSFYKQDANDPNSSVAFEYGEEAGLKSVSAMVTIQLAGANVSAAITHELLHIQMAIRGFPIFVKPVTDDPFVHQVAMQAFVFVYNQVGHAIFLDEFLAHGFSLSQLIHDPDLPAELEQSIQMVAEELKIHPESLVYYKGQWNKYYFGVYLSCRLGFRDDGLANKVEAAGRKLFGESASEDATWIRDWFGRGDFRSPEKYAAAIHALHKKIIVCPAQLCRLELFPDEPRAIFLDVPP
jgi:hypothetical protein